MPANRAEKPAPLTRSDFPLYTTHSPPQTGAAKTVAAVAAVLGKCP